MSGDLADTGKILIYQNEKGDTRIDVYFKEDTIWMPQRSLSELYQVTPQNITLHIKNIYEDGELDETATCKNYLQVQIEGSGHVSHIYRGGELEPMATVRKFRTVQKLLKLI